MTETTPSPWLTKAEAAEYMRCSPRTIDAWANAGRITRHRVAGLQSVRFRRDELDSLAEPVPAGTEPETD
jgi:excisionase family DNA binding protein